MHDTKERLSLMWIFALLNYLYADVLALFAFVGSPNSAPHLPQWALLGSAVLMEIPIAMILASRLLPFWRRWRYYGGRERRAMRAARRHCTRWCGWVPEGGQHRQVAQSRVGGRA